MAIEEEVIHLNKKHKLIDQTNKSHTDEIALEETIAKQNTELMRVRQALLKVCSQEDLQMLLIFNDSSDVEGLDNLLDRCADFLTFGALYKCQKCLKGDMIFSKHGYTCNAAVDEWVMCGYFDEKPLRLKCLIPDHLKHKEFFATCEPTMEHRAVRPLVIKDNDTNHVAHSSKSISRKNRTDSQSQLKVTSIKLKNGTAVDPQSKLENVAHVFGKDNCLYTCILGLTDIAKNKNSYFKLQVLSADVPTPQGKNFWLFSSWGRIGTNIGSSKVEALVSSEIACENFKKLYFEQTGNVWKSIDVFKKYPGKFYPIDVNYNDVSTNTGIASFLSPAVEDLMKLIFNVTTMKMTMKEFHLDLEKMPLGKLSVQQLEASYSSLFQLEDALSRHGSKSELVGLSNKFYTLIPHNFGLAKAPIIDTLEKINEKREMVDSLLDIQQAFAMMTKGSANPDINSFDAYYNQLNADVISLDRNSQEFALIDQYSRNTQVHGYKIEILDVFKVNRHGENIRYQPFKHLHNRLLLWHGSRLTNFASIVSNGLKITAQLNGSMFGRGVYFADMISKSANYCLLNATSGIAILALCEVALGNIYELVNATNIVQPPNGFQSVKGKGQTCPDPNQSHIFQDGVVIPFGKAINSRTAGGLLFNEYIVYNEAQIRMQYLVKVKIG